MLMMTLQKTVNINKICNVFKSISIYSLNISHPFIIADNGINTGHFHHIIFVHYLPHQMGMVFPTGQKMNVYFLWENLTSNYYKLILSNEYIELQGAKIILEYWEYIILVHHTFLYKIFFSLILSLLFYFQYNLKTFTNNFYRRQYYTNYSIYLCIKNKNFD